MKILLVLALAVLASAGPLQPLDEISPRNPIDDMIESVKQLMRNGDPDLGIPVLDPLNAEVLDGCLSQGGILDLCGTFKRVLIEGLSNFNKDKFTFNPLTMKASFKFDWVDTRFRGFQDSRGHFFTYLPLWIYGDFDLEAYDFTIEGFAQINLINGGYMNIKDMDVTVLLDRFRSAMDGMVTGGDLSDLLNVVLEDAVPSLLYNFQDDNSANINALLKPALNRVLNGIKFSDLFP